MGCCQSAEEEADERKSLLKNEQSKKQRAGGAQQANKGKGKAPAGPSSRQDNYAHIGSLEGSQAVPIQEEKRLADVAAETQKNFIAVPPSSLQEPNRLDQDFLQDREEYYRQQLAGFGQDMNAGMAKKGSGHGKVQEGQALFDLLNRNPADIDRDVALMEKVCPAVTHALASMHVEDVGSLTVTFDDVQEL